MRLSLIAVLLAAAAPLAAQPPERRPTPDAATAEILKAAATDTAEKIARYRTAGDTLWAVLVNRRTADAREVRLERRGAAAWTRVSEKRVPSPLPARLQWVGDTTVAPAVRLEPPKQKP